MLPDAPDPFPAEALQANRNGMLTDAQKRSHAPAERGGRGHDLLLAAFCVLLALVVLRATGPAGSPLLRPLVALGAVAAAVVLVLRPKGPARRRLERDLRAGRVVSVDGAISKWSESVGQGPPGSRRYRLEVAGRKLRVNPRGYEAAPDAGIVRAYYLPESQRVVNLERLPDRPPPRELLGSPAEVLKSLGTAMGLHGRTAAAETRADLAALMTALAPERSDGVAPPPLPERAGPLDQVILGRWRSGAVNLAFSSDGTVAMSGLGGLERQGRWWVDAEGRLHSDAVGGDGAEAWVAGDALTISAEGTTLTFRRV